ncbi:hypothetical protein R6Z07F_000528 [Ovis aries]
MGVIEGFGDAEWRFPLPIAPRRSSCRSSRPPGAGRGNFALLSCNLRRVDLRLTHCLRGDLKIGKKDFKATFDLQRLSII